MKRKVHIYHVTAVMKDGRRIRHNIAAFTMKDARKDFKLSFPAAHKAAKRIEVTRHHD